jgi:hypothetical protein
LPAARPFTLIKNGKLSPIDAERYVPGKIVAAVEGDSWLDIVYRCGERFTRKTIYKDAAHAWADLKTFVADCGKKDTHEISRLKFWATKGKGSDMPEDLKPEHPPEAPEAISPERHEKYGHRWTLEEFLAEFESLSPEPGETLIAYDSQEFSHYGWQHTFMVRTDNRGPVSGKRLFVEAAVSERNELRAGRWSGMHAEGKYGNLRHKIAPLEPASTTT